MATKHPLEPLARRFLGKHPHQLEPEEIHVLEQMRKRLPSAAMPVTHPMR